MAIATALQLSIILDSAMSAFKRNIAPLQAFSTAFRREQAPLQKGASMLVPYYPLVTAASKDFAGNYDFTGAAPVVQSKEVIVNKRKYQPMIATSEEFSRFNWDPEKYGKQIGNKLAFDIVSDVLSLVTLANFGAAAVTAAAADFDTEDTSAIKLLCDVANWPQEMRSLVLAWAYYNNLVGDPAVRAAYAFGSPEAIREGTIPRVDGFVPYGANGIPANGQNLVGFAAHPSAILIGFSPVEPADSVKKVLQSYEALADPEGTGLILEHRVWGDPDTDSHKEVLEANYGYALGEPAALKRIVSA